MKRADIDRLVENREASTRRYYDDLRMLNVRHVTPIEHRDGGLLASLAMKRADVKRVVDEELSMQRDRFRRLKRVLREFPSEVAVNAVMVAEGLRPSFMIHSADYMPLSTPEEAMAAHAALNANIVAPAVDYAVGAIARAFPVDVYDTGYGDKLITSAHGSDKIKSMLRHYFATDDKEILGRILGYPCAGDSHKASVERTLVELYDRKGDTVLSNVCSGTDRIAASRAAFRAIARVMREKFGERLHIRTRYMPVLDSETRRSHEP